MTAPITKEQIAARRADLWTKIGEAVTAAGGAWNAEARTVDGQTLRLELDAESSYAYGTGTIYAGTFRAHWEAHGERRQNRPIRADGSNLSKIAADLRRDAERQRAHDEMRDNEDAAFQRNRKIAERINEAAGVFRKDPRWGPYTEWIGPQAHAGSSGIWLHNLDGRGFTAGQIVELVTLAQRFERENARPIVAGVVAICGGDAREVTP